MLEIRKEHGCYRIFDGKDHLGNLFNEADAELFVRLKELLVVKYKCPVRVGDYLWIPMYSPEGGSCPECESSPCECEHGGEAKTQIPYPKWSYRVGSYAKEELELCLREAEDGEVLPLPIEDVAPDIVIGE